MFYDCRTICIQAPMQIVQLSLVNVDWYVLTDQCFQHLTHSTYVVNVTLIFEVINDWTDIMGRSNVLLDRSQHWSGNKDNSWTGSQITVFHAQINQLSKPSTHITNLRYMQLDGAFWGSIWLKLTKLSYFSR